MKRLFITIYAVLLITLFLIPFAVNPIVDRIFENKAAIVNRELSKGTFFLIANQLKGLDETAMRKQLKVLEPHFGYPLGLYHASELTIDKKDQTDFQNNLVIEEDEKDLLIQRLCETDLVLTMGGPFPGDEVDFQVIIIFWGLFTLALTIPALGWSLYINRDIKKIEEASNRFAKGDLKARVNISKFSSMFQIVSAFNHMADQSERLLESQKEVTNSVSHEIRTPLARIKFSLQMLIDNLTPDHSNKIYLSEIGTDVEEIESLVDEILTYSRFGRKRQLSEVLTQVEMNSWLKTIVDREKKNNPDQTIDYTRCSDPEILIADCEPVYLGWAVRNLIHNALRHAAHRVSISIVSQQDSFSIHVDDDGNGIPDDKKENVFEPFFRLNKSRSKKSGGYGLGLAIAKRISHWHKGQIQVSTSPLGGARFTICIPLHH